MSDSVYALAGGKGGVGTTTTAVNLAGTFRATGRTVALLDADLAMSDFEHVLGVEPDATIHDVLSGDAELDAAIDPYEVAVGGRTDTVDVIAGASDLLAFAEADTERLHDVIAVLDETYDVVVVDTATGLSQEAAVPMQAADELLVVTTPDAASVSDTATVLDFAENVGVDVAGVVVSETGDGAPPSAVAADLDVDLLGAVPDFDAADPTEVYQNVVASLLLGDALPEESLDFDESVDTDSDGERTVPQPNISVSEAMESPGKSADGADEADATDTETGDDGEDVEIGGAFGKFVKTFGGSGGD